MHTITNHARHRSTQRRSRRAFTLLEVIVVVTIIALLAAIIAPKLLGNIGRSKQKVAKAETASLAQQVHVWMADNGYSRLPDDFSLDMLLEGNDPYLSKKDDLLDPWGNPNVLVVPGEVNRDFDIKSYGADAKPEGTDEDADVTN
jgi:general secretion pathway protein G